MKLGRVILALLLFVESAYATPTSYMGLNLPEPGVTVGPDWAEQLNSVIETIDAHDHSSGKGARITPAGMNITADLEFNNNNATELYSSRYNQLAATLSGSVLNSIYSVGGNLYWNNGSGVAVQVTSGTAVNNSVSGAFASSTPALFPYSIVSGDAQKVLLVDTTLARTMNLPAATTAIFFAIKDASGLSGTNPITVVRSGSDTIDGVSGNRTLKSNYGWWFFISNGVNGWNIAEGMPGSVPSNGQIPVGNGAGYTLATLTGTSNQVSVTNGAGSITLSTPQNIATTSSPTFTGLQLNSDLYFFGSGIIRQTTSDGSDTAYTYMDGGGGPGTARGAAFVAYGNEAVGNGGDAVVSSGAASSANKVEILNATKSSSVVLATSGDVQITPGASQYIDLAGTTAGSAGAIAGYLSVKINGNTYKLPYYNP